MPTTATPVELALADIAEQILSIETLAVRHSDELDFHDVAVRSVREALLAAYRLGLDDKKSRR